MATGLRELGDGLRRALADLEPIQHAMGQEGKKVALDQFGRDLGGDRAFSNWPRRVTLNAGYDLGNPVQLNLRPAGLVILADQGRKRSSRIYPGGRKGQRGGRRQTGTRALKFGGGYRAWSQSEPSRGFGTINHIVDTLDDTLPGVVLDETADQFLKGV